MPGSALKVMTEGELAHWLDVLDDDRIEGLAGYRRESGHEGKPANLRWKSSTIVHAADERTSWSTLVILGRPRAGKDTVADYLADTYQKVKRVAFSDALMIEVNAIFTAWAAEFGTTCQPHRITEMNKNHPPYRKILQDWGVIQRRVHGDDYWAKRALDSAATKGRDGASLIVVTGARCPGDIKVAEACGAAVWCVVRPSLAAASDALHPIEHLLDHVPLGTWDALLVNEDDNLALLHKQVEAFLPRSPRGDYLKFLSAP